MKYFAVFTVFVSLLAATFAMEKPSFHTKGRPTGPLKHGEYWWNPQLSPTGPVVVLVSIPQQTMHVLPERDSDRPLDH